MTGVWVGVFGLVCMPCVPGVMWGLARIKVTHCVLLVYQVHCVTVEALEYEHGGCGGGYSPPLALCWSLWNPSNLSFPLILKYHPLCLNPFIFPPLLYGLRPIAPCNDPSFRQCHCPHATVHHGAHRLPSRYRPSVPGGEDTYRRREYRVPLASWEAIRRGKLPEAADVARNGWTVTPAPDDIRDRAEGDAHRI